MREYIDKLGYRPRTAVWELTLACNASCLHCGSRAGKPRDRELDTGEALRVARDLASLGCEHATLSGGEPLLRRDWPAIAEALAAAGVTVGLISNGFAFDASEARRALDAGLGHVAFSIDGLEASHDRMRGRPGAFRRTTAAFETARAAGLLACAVTHVNRWNIDELDEMHAALRDLGVRSWKLQLCNPAGGMAGHRDVVLRPRDLLHLVPHMARLRRRGLPFVETSDSIGYFGPYEETLRTTWRKELTFWTGCYAGCRAIGIESGGNVKGCLALPSERHGTSEFLEGNVLESGLAAIWERPGAFAYNREFHPDDLTGFCRTCPYAAICRAGCHWTALAHGGTIRENRYCYYRVAAEAAAERRGPRRWFAGGLAPAAIVAALGFPGCYESYGPAGDPPDGAVAADVHCPTAEEACCFCEYMGPAPIPAGCPDPCNMSEYAEPLPVPVPDASTDAAADADSPTDADAAADVPPRCPDPCVSDDYGVPPPAPEFPPGCPYECGGTDVCPTEACCDCDYGEPEPAPVECADPCDPRWRAR